MIMAFVNAGGSMEREGLGDVSMAFSICLHVDFRDAVARRLPESRSFHKLGVELNEWTAYMQGFKK